MFTTARGKRIYYECYGKGPKTILFVHGWGGTHKSLKRLAIKPVKKFRTVVIDLPGFGKSQNPDPSWGVEEYAECVVDFLKKQEIQNPVYFGHSFGGSLGIYIAAKGLYPLAKLVLCASAFKRTGKKSRLASGVNSVVNSYVPFLRSIVSRVKPFFYKIFFPDSDLARFPHLESNFRKIITRDLSDLPEKITIPTLILWGGRDTYTPPALADELEEKIPGSCKILFPYKSHNLPIRYPDEVWNKMRGFIA
ncbi:MAG: alpha/beta hydrolase [Patescibacteria group bacterium]|nr:alpha/beta hydrolase [Patescibacteria group bacterium]